LEEIIWDLGWVWVGVEVGIVTPVRVRSGLMLDVDEI
jgi:hypothetical protein